MMIRLLSLVLVLICASFVQAQGPRGLAVAIGNAGVPFHNGFQGRENTYWESGNRVFGVRFRARQTWRASPGHAGNLPLFGLRVGRGGHGIGVVGRQ